MLIIIYLIYFSPHQPTLLRKYQANNLEMISIDEAFIRVSCKTKQTRHLKHPLHPLFDPRIQRQSISLFELDSSSQLIPQSVKTLRGRFRTSTILHTD